MKEKLQNLHTNCYVPISNFRVSACVVTKSEEEYFGVNVEDASTRAGTCAERAAIFNAITAGVKKNDFKEIHLMAESGDIVMPCFVCRQLLTEFFDKKSLVYSYDTKGRVKVHTIEELCPYPFGEEDLK